MGPYDISAQLTALVAVGALALITRWVFRAPARQPTLPVDASDSPDLGLLSVIMSGMARADTVRCRAVLGEHGIRSSVSRRRDGSMDVLVFHADADRARLLLGP